MKKILILVFCLISINHLFGQDKMIVDKPFNGNPVYSGFSSYIDSFPEIPSVIQYNVNGYLNRILGSMSDSVVFSHGQIVDLKMKFENDSTTFDRSWIVPKYDLNFKLSDNSIGIKSYYLQIRLDEYGQILFSNWPKANYNDKSRFASRSDIEKYALRQAELKGYNLKDYIIDFKYNEKFDKLCWIFKFPDLIEKNRKEYNAFEIAWNTIEIIDEYNTMTSTVY